MTADTLALRFQRSKGQPVQHEGNEVFPLYQRPIPKGRWRITISRIAAKDTPVQGLRLKASIGKFQINGQCLSDVILWADTSPDNLTFYLSSNKDVVLKVWNVWSVSGILQAWIGNAGMLIQDRESDVKLECSDGVGDVSFGDLIASIRFDCQTDDVQPDSLIPKS
jgi:hypothetical protein